MSCDDANLLLVVSAFGDITHDEGVTFSIRQKHRGDV